MQYSNVAVTKQPNPQPDTAIGTDLVPWVSIAVPKPCSSKLVDPVAGGTSDLRGAVRKRGVASLAIDSDGRHRNIGKS